MREALLERPLLPAALRAQIAVATAKDLSVAASRWLPRERAERVAREARDQAISSIASSCPEDERAELVRSLRACGALTPALLLRSLLGGERDLFAEALAELSGLPLPRVAAFALAPRGEGFAALAHKAGLKSQVLPAFAAALAAIKTSAGEVGGGLKLPLVQKVIDECERRDDPALAKVLALLWRFAAEAARAEAAGFARDAIASASLDGCRGSTLLPPTTTPVSSSRRTRISTGRASARRQSSSAPRSPTRATTARRPSNCRSPSSPLSTTRREREAVWS